VGGVLVDVADVTAGDDENGVAADAAFGSAAVGPCRNGRAAWSYWRGRAAVTGITTMVVSNPVNGFAARFAYRRRRRRHSFTMSQSIANTAPATTPMIT
jgi:hypothetical protein